MHPPFTLCDWLCDESCDCVCMYLRRDYTYFLSLMRTSVVLLKVRKKIKEFSSSPNLNLKWNTSITQKNHTEIVVIYCMCTWKLWSLSSKLPCCVLQTRIYSFNYACCLPVKPPSAILNMNLVLNPFLSSFLLSSISSKASLSPFSRPSNASSPLMSSATANVSEVKTGADGAEARHHENLLNAAMHSRRTGLVFLVLAFCQRRVSVSLFWRLPRLFAGLHCG